MSDSNEALALTKRYTDAYVVARATVGFGSAIKVIGILLAMLICGGTVVAASQTGQEVGVILLVVGIASSIFIGVLLYLLGILVSAQGQILMASLDSAVNSSPFLTNDQRANAMSLKIFGRTNLSSDAIQTSVPKEIKKKNVEAGTCEICGKKFGLLAKLNPDAKRCREHMDI